MICAITNNRFRNRFQVNLGDLKLNLLQVNKIIAHKINVFINRQLIYNYPEQLFADAGIMAIEHADFEGIERLALVLGMFTYYFFYPDSFIFIHSRDYSISFL